jgi:hypothetical protein
VSAGTVRLANAKCLACEAVLSKERIRAQLLARRGGADDARLLAVVSVHPSRTGRVYRLPTQRDIDAIRSAGRWAATLTDDLPEEEIPTRHKRNSGFGVKLYGMKLWRDLFTARQKGALVSFMQRSRSGSESEAVREMLALALSRGANAWCALCRWHLTGEKNEGVYSRQALPIVWDFCEANPLSDATGGYSGAVDWITNVAASLPPCGTGHVECADACAHVLPDDSCNVWFTDPPYYDAIAYADLSDFFFVWLKRVLPGHRLLRDPFDVKNSLTPKNAECIVNEERSVDGMLMDRAFFETRIARAFEEGRRVTRDDGVGAIVFAHKTTEGWEALLSGLIKAGWSITASWPIATELGSRLSARETASLATSVHLVCRPRPENVATGDWAEVFRQLPERIGNWMEKLSDNGVRGADLVFACIGPAMEVYSRYSKVEDAEGREIPLGGDPEATEPHKRGFLAYVWEIVGRTALGQVLGTTEARARNGAGGALEEDARLTPLFLWTHQSTASNSAADEDSERNTTETPPDEEDYEAPSAASKKGLTLIYDVVRRFSQPLGIHLDTWDDRIVETKKGIVRLLPVKERAEHLLGDSGASGVADVIERSRGGPINFQFAFMNATEERSPKAKGKGRKRGKSTPDEAPTVASGTTTLDRVHIAMLLQASGKSNALRTMLKAEQDRGPDFVRLANALSALYPRDSEEKRLLDAMLLAAPR